MKHLKLIFDQVFKLFVFILRLLTGSNPLFIHLSRSNKCKACNDWFQC